MTGPYGRLAEKGRGDGVRGGWGEKKVEEDEITRKPYPVFLETT